MKKPKNWVKEALGKSPSALSVDKKLPAKKLAKAANPRMSKQAVMARTLSGLRK